MKTSRGESWIAFQRRRRRIRRRFEKKMGRPGDFERPQSYQEKLQFRKLYGNHEFYASVADKYAVREFVAERIGEQYLIPLLAVHDRLTPDAFEDLPDPFIIKATHGCKWHEIVRDKRALDVAKAVEYFNSRLEQRYGRRHGEHHYTLIEPKIVIERLLLDDGEIPVNYDMFCYRDGDEFDLAIAIEMPDGKSAAHYDRDWNLWESGFTKEQEERYAKPENFDRMVEIAKTLSTGFDFVRVDLYNLAGEIFFGELTVTPSSGFTPIRSELRAARRSDMWKLDVHNPRLYRVPPAVRRLHAVSP